VDEVLAVGDAAFRRRALEALRCLIAEGRTVLFISHDMWNVRRLCSDILWMEEGRVRAYGPAGEIAERYLSDVNAQALAGQSVNLQSHRGGTGEIRYSSVELVDEHGRPATAIPAGGALTVRAGYRSERAVDRPVFQLSIIDVDSGIVVTSATSDRSEMPPGPVEGAARDGGFECRFATLPLRPGQYALRLSILDRHQLASYDIVTAGPRFAVVGRGQGVDALAASGDIAGDVDGLVSVPYEFDVVVPTLPVRTS
jgi:homopolymeric O-antigen transport system ATP-binding protein